MRLNSSKEASLEPFDWRALKESYIIGVDEVGRGCLAGSVYAGAVLLPKDCLLEGLTDSKLIRPEKRAKICELLQSSYRCGTAFATVEEITRLNIREASLLAMKRAIESLNLSLEEQKDCHILVDGRDKVPHINLKQSPLIKGDLRAEPISAASILAKVIRDQELVRLAALYPNYGFELHKGYATREHKTAIKKYGPTPIHRPSFGGVREYL